MSTNEKGTQQKPFVFYISFSRRRKHPIFDLGYISPRDLFYLNKINPRDWYILLTNYCVIF